MPSCHINYLATIARPTQIKAATLAIHHHHHHEETPAINSRVSFKLHCIRARTLRPKLISWLALAQARARQLCSAFRAANHQNQTISRTPEPRQYPVFARARARGHLSDAHLCTCAPGLACASEQWSSALWRAPAHDAWPECVAIVCVCV